MANINSNEPLFYPYSVLVNKCSGSYNNIKHPYAQLYVADVVKNVNIKVFDLMSIANEMSYVFCHEACACKCRLYASLYNNRPHWSNNKCRCECKELINMGKRHYGFT